VHTYGFRSRTGKAIVTCWLAIRCVSFDADPSINGDLQIKNSGIQNPVLIDVVTGQITAVSREYGTKCCPY